MVKEATIPVRFVPMRRKFSSRQKNELTAASAVKQK